MLGYLLMSRVTAIPTLANPVLTSMVVLEILGIQLLGICFKSS